MGINNDIGPHRLSLEIICTGQSMKAVYKEGGALMSPIAFRALGLEIRWYGILIAFALLSGTLLALRESRRQGFSENYILDIIIISIPAAIIGARLYYVIFQWQDYMGDFMQIFNIRSGGLAIHGGIIAAAIAAFAYTRVKMISFLKAADLCAPGLILGQAIGRWGNFFNQEAHGGPVNSEFISHFPEFIQRQLLIGGNYYQPAFLYESLWDLLVFLVLLIYRRKYRVRGRVFMLYVALYSAGRYYIEGMRTDSLMIGMSMRTAQLVSIILIIISVVSMYILGKHQRRI
jgi:phosphatidylglycerol:prolipoprotein diacylglycerol transferase